MRASLAFFFRKKRCSQQVNVQEKRAGCLSGQGKLEEYGRPKAYYFSPTPVVFANNGRISEHLHLYIILASF